MELLTTRNFNGVALDCYKAENENDGFWVTREQIGRMLEYADPMKSVAKIHERNHERLDKFSSIARLTTVEGTRTVTRDMTVYNFKGFLEICRYSNQPKADQVIDFAWSVMDEIRKTVRYCAIDLTQTANLQAAEIMVREAFKLITGKEIASTRYKPQHWTMEQMSRKVKWPIDAVIFRAKNLCMIGDSRFGFYDGEDWVFNKKGRDHFLSLVSRKIIKIEDGYEIYEDGYRHIHWDFKA